MTIPLQSRPPAGSKEESRQAREVWRREYERLIEQATRCGAVERGRPARERRAHPRFRLRERSIGVQIETQAPVIDVSLGGIGYYSRHYVPPGDVVRLVLEKAFLVEVEVVECELLEPGEPRAAEWPFRMHCRFTRPEEGMQLLVMLEHMDNLILAPEA